ncbi:hypothetical protein E4U14_001872 [Claviceps sp. LM454 group G7]|nr:hypothetical protein E4U14_001872 [Claviceps sp. LM454 group G7]
MPSVKSYPLQTVGGSYPLRSYFWSKNSFDIALSDIEQNVDSSWIPVNPYELVLQLSTRAAARLFVSEPICRDEDFLNTSASYSRNVFDAIATSRSLGHVITPYLGRWIPSIQAAQQQFQRIQKMLCSEVDRRRENPKDSTQDDFLQWCMELARTEEEAHAASVAHRTLGILSMAAVHTTAMSSTHILFDLISDEDLKEKLREEQNQILKQGWKNITQQTMLSMRKLDSLMRESQRVNPSPSDEPSGNQSLYQTGFSCTQDNRLQLQRDA